MEVNPNLTDKAMRDYQLVQAAINNGDQKAYAALMNNYRDSLYFMLLKMTNNANDADDLTIEAFGKAFKKLEQYTPDYAFSTWLSGHSRGATRDEASVLERLAERWFQRQTEPPWDLMIMGHIHHGYLLQRGPRQLAALAGWFDPLSYGLLRGGQFQLLEFRREQRPGLG